MKRFLIEDALVGSKIIDFSRVCNLIKLSFKTLSGTIIFIHIQCFFRIFDNGQLIISSENLYTPSKNFKRKLLKKFNYSKIGDTLFDYTANEISNKLFSSEVQKVSFRDSDLIIMLQNDIILEALVNVTINDETEFCENYRIFSEDKMVDHYVV